MDPSRRAKHLIVSAFLVLDFSGSMDQTIEDRPKFKVLQQGIEQYLEPISAETKFTTIVFGSERARACEVLETRRALSPAQVRGYVSKLRPGPYGKTPLAAAITQLGRYPREIEGSSVLIVTDGADTCSQDPCAALMKLDQELHVRERIRFDIVGFDLNDQKRDFACFKDIKDRLQNIEVVLHEAATVEGLLSSLRIGQRRMKPPPKWGSIRINGAPDSATFTAAGSSLKQKSQSWTGGFALQVPAGRYQLKHVRAGTRALTVTVHSQQSAQVPYGDFFKDPMARVSFATAPVALRAIPSAQTKAAHVGASGFDIPADRPADSIDAIYFGKWTFKVLEPWWLRDATGEVDFSPGQKVRLELPEMLGQTVVWFVTGVALDYRVLKAGEHRLLLPPTLVRVPLLKSWEVEWLVR